MDDTGSQYLWDMGLPAIGALLQQGGFDSYRARQLFRWLHLRGISDPHQMTDLPQQLRAWLTERYSPLSLVLAAKQVSRDRSIKYVWRTSRGNPVETVLMPPYQRSSRSPARQLGAPSHVALCVSCQSGCAFQCKFCATGAMGLKQSLTVGQILAQLYLAEQDSGLEVERILFMGMGEPLRNLAAVQDAILVLTNEQGRAWSPRRITLSTVGIASLIQRAADELPRINLSLSLHFTTDHARAQHMPQAEMSLAKLAGALYYYRRVNGGKLTIEYALMQGLNDSETDARRLIRFARLAPATGTEALLEAEESEAPSHLQPLPLHVNLITYNPVAEVSQVYQPASEERVSQFAGLLADAGVPVTVRRSRGVDIAAACGMLGGALAKPS